MRRHPFLFVFALLLVFQSASARNKPETEWMQVLLDGRKIGWMKSVRETGADKVTTRETMHVRIERAGTGVTLEQEQKSVETPAGVPLGFGSRTSMSGFGSEVEGVVSGDNLKIKQTMGGASSEQSQPWPKGALLSEGLRKLEREKGLAPGTEYEALAFQPDTLGAVNVKTKVIGRERVTIVGKTRELHHLSQTIELPGSPVSAELWIDEQFNVQRMQMPMLGVNLEMLACDEACAHAPDQPADVLERTLAPAPRALDADLLGGVARYAIVVDNDAVKSLPTTGEQAAKALGEHRYELDIAAQPVAGREKAPEPADSQATRWLQSDAPELKKLLAQAGAENAAPRERMKTLETFVRGYIRNKSLRVGYASALETVKSREGDCTEHALLLAALGRAAGIPTRVVNGLAYTSHFNGKDNVFVPHAWAQAFVDGKWQSFDAALGGFDTGHIALSFGDGDPAGFYAGVNLLGQVRVESIEAAPKP